MRHTIGQSIDKFHPYQLDYLCSCILLNLRIDICLVRHDSINVFLSHRLSTVLGDHVYSSRVGKFMREKVAVDVTRCAPGTQVRKYISVRTNPLSKRIIDKRVKVGKYSITCGPLKH